MSKRLPCLAIFFIMVAAIVSAEQTQNLNNNKGEITLRVRVLVKEAPSFPITTTGDYWLYDEIKGEEILYGGNSFSFVTESVPGGIKIPFAGVFSGSVRLIPVGKAKVRIGNQLYRGELLITKQDNHLLLINFIDLEEYLYGVIRKEISPNWPVDAVKAQAVAARTYAFYQMIVNQAQPYDLDATTKSQVYGGYKSEAPGSINAVEKTKGEVLTFRGEPVLALFHSNCGGATEDVKNVFGNDDIPYLRSVPCQYGRKSKHYRWEQTIALDKISTALSNRGYQTGRLRELTAVKNRHSDRIGKINIIHSRGRLTLTGTEFRKALGYNLIKSTIFNVKVKNGQAYFSGRGWGHGVGLCQDGMRDMAERGFSYIQILQHYYQGTSLETLYEIYRRAGFVN